MSPLDLKIIDIRKGLFDGSWTSVSLVSESLRRCRLAKALNVLITIQDENLLLDLAKRLDKERTLLPLNELKDRHLIHGIPFIVKDNICTSDLPTTSGALVMKNAYAGFDARVVQKLREHGGILLGKANLTEWSNWYCEEFPFGWSALGGLTLNPHNPMLNPGSSSSGSAACAVLRLAPVILASETHGSLWNPCSSQLVVGMKPTPGLVSRHNIIKQSLSLDTIGPVSTHVADAAYLLQIVAGADICDHLTLSRPESLNACDYSDLEQYDISTATMGLWQKHPLGDIQKELKENDLLMLSIWSDYIKPMLEGLGTTVLQEDLHDIMKDVDYFENYSQRQGCAHLVHDVEIMIRDRVCLVLI